MKMTSQIFKFQVNFNKSLIHLILWRSMLGLTFAVLFLFSYNDVSALELSSIDETKWTRCAGETQMCKFDGRRIVRFGREDKFKFIETNDEVLCSTSVFGDPLPAQRKSCWYGEKIRSMPPEKSEAVAKVNVFVIDDEKQLNSKKWSKAYIQRVLSQASELLDNQVIFEVSDFKIIIDDRLYSSNKQNDILTQYLMRNHESGRISLGISAPMTIDSAGAAIQDSFILDLKPKVVIRSRLNDQSKEDLIETARIFLHELGHTLGFSHDGTLTAKPYNTDDWWFVANARKFLVTMVSWSSLKVSADKKEISRFDCKIAGFEPDTNLFEDLRTQAFDLNECASRCLITDGCVAIAQGTWNNASCLLFTRGAKILKRRQYGNANTCWLKGEGPATN